MDEIEAAFSDRNGEPLLIGDTVRSYDFPRVPDLDVYAEGILLGIGAHCIDGSRRYEILVKTVNHPSDEPYTGGEPSYVKKTIEKRYAIYPPINGTPIAGGGHTSGVVKVLDAPSAELKTATYAVHYSGQVNVNATSQEHADAIISALIQKGLEDGQYLDDYMQIDLKDKQ